MTGQTISHYRVLEKLGEGGMGVVWKAEDLLLKRVVALKFLHASDDLPRLLREAQTAGALMHPNICAVHEVDPERGFLAMELVEGESLAGKIGGRPLPVEEAIGLAAQICEGLKAAHEKGITHRDIKSGNIIVTKKGQAKLLDFGLARAAGHATLTRDGAAAGTPGYMAPEQMRGEAVDHRADIWAVGAVLHEMLTGHLPMGQAETLPEGLGRVVRKALAADPRERYQHVEDMLVDLRRGAAAPSLKPARPRWLWAAAVAAGVALVAFAAWYGTSRLRAPKLVPLRFTQLTNQAGQETYPSLSPDGNSFVYASRASGNWDIYLQRVGGQTAINLTKDCLDDDTQPAYSPDGGRIAFRSERAGGGIFLMGATGESPNRLADLGYNPAWSPDGAQILCATQTFVRPDSAVVSSDHRLFSVNVSTGERRLLAGPEQAPRQPQWSPHGHRIAYWASLQGQRDVWTIPAGGGTPVAVTNDVFTDWNPAWSPDGRYLYFASDRGGSMNIWRAPIEERSGRVLGNPEPLTTPSPYSGFFGLSRDGQRLLYVQLSRSANLHKVAFDPARGATAGAPLSITRGTGENLSPELSPDGEWLVFNVVGKQEDIFLIRPDGSGQRQLTDDPYRDRHPHWSPNGQIVSFISNRTGQNQVWTIHPDGSNLRQLTFETRGGVGSHAWSPDGARLAYNVNGGDSFIMEAATPWTTQTLQRLPGLPKPNDFRPYAWSPDGRRLAGYRTTITLNSGIYVISLDDPPIIRELTDFGSIPRWLNDSRRLLFHGTDHKIHLVDAQTRAVSEVLSVSPSTILMLSLSSDNRTIYFDIVTTEADIWLATLQ